MAEYLSEEDMNTGEYISRDLALKQLNSTCLATGCNNYNGVMCIACPYADAMDFIDTLPAADVQPVKRGKWIFEHCDMICSACEYTYSDEMALMGREFDDDSAFDFCPHCGADMREENKNEP